MPADPLRIRVGQGFDVHPFAEDPDRPLVLGGLRFPGRGLAGHSDADPVAHAVTDALLGAAGLGDIGQHFPDTDPALAGADSIELLRRAVDAVRAAGWAPGNVDCTVVLDAPKLAPRRDEMQLRLSDAVGAPVTVKGKRPEGLGALGRQAGVAGVAGALGARAARWAGPARAPRGAVAPCPPGAAPPAARARPPASPAPAPGRRPPARRHAAVAAGRG